MWSNSSSDQASPASVSSACRIRISQLWASTLAVCWGFSILRPCMVITDSAEHTGCRIFSEAREKLRQECLRGRIFGTDAPQSTSSTSRDLSSFFLSLPKSATDDIADDGWRKNSWRRKEGSKSRGRVKGMAKTFEDETGGELKRSRTMSSARLDELEEIKRIRADRTQRSMSVSTDSGCSSFETFKTAVGTVRRPSLADAFSHLDGNENDQHAQREASTISGYECADSGASSDFGEGQTTGLAAEGISSRPRTAMDWGNVQPIDLTIEEAEALSTSITDEIFDTGDEESVQTPTIIIKPACYSEGDPTLSNSSEDANPLVDESIEDNPNYQFRMRTHGEDAYSLIRPTPNRRPSLIQAVDSEATTAEDESVLTLAQSPTPRLSLESQISDLAPSIYADITREDQEMRAPLSAVESSFAHEGSPDDDVEPHFASSNGNIITVKYHSVRKHMRSARSVENFGSLRLASVRSVTSKRDSANLKTLFERADAGRPGSVQDPDEEFSLKSRDGNMVVMSRKQLEEVCAIHGNLQRPLQLTLPQRCKRGLQTWKPSWRQPSSPPTLSHWRQTAGSRMRRAPQHPPLSTRLAKRREQCQIGSVER